MNACRIIWQGSCRVSGREVLDLFYKVFPGLFIAGFIGLIALVLQLRVDVAVLADRINNPVVTAEGGRILNMQIDANTEKLDKLLERVNKHEILIYDTKEGILKLDARNDNIATTTNKLWNILRPHDRPKPVPASLYGKGGVNGD